MMGRYYGGARHSRTRSFRGAAQGSQQFQATERAFLCSLCSALPKDLTWNWEQGRAGGEGRTDHNQNRNQNRQHSQNQNQSQRGQLSPPHPQGPPAPTTNQTRSPRGGKGNHLQAGWTLAQLIFLSLKPAGLIKARRPMVRADAWTPWPKPTFERAGRHRSISMLAFKFPGMGVGIFKDGSRRRSINAHMKSSSSPSSSEPSSPSPSSTSGAVLGFLLLALGTASLGAAFLLLEGFGLSLFSCQGKLYRGPNFYRGI